MRIECNLNQIARLDKAFNRARDDIDDMLNWSGLEEGARLELEIIRSRMNIVDDD